MGNCADAVRAMADRNEAQKAGWSRNPTCGNPLPCKDHPQITDLAGMNPDVVGGMSSEEFLAVARAAKAEDERARAHAIVDRAFDIAEEAARDGLRMTNPGIYTHEYGREVGSLIIGAFARAAAPSGDLVGERDKPITGGPQNARGRWPEDRDRGNGNW